MRSIPKASRQMRGVANLLASRNFVPIVYPEHISTSQYPGQQDPQTGQMMPNPEYQQARDASKKVARGTGHFLREEWKKQRLTELLAFMIILTGKHGVSYLQVWPDSVEEAIRTQVYDAFDIYVIEAYRETEHLKFLN